MSTGSDSESLREAVAQALKAEERLAGYDIQVDVDGNRAVLQGVVDVLAEKHLAGRVAAQVPGIAAVDNAVTISTDGAVTDKDVAFEVAEELNADPNVRLINVGVEVECGNARLVGQVNSEEERRAAAQAAARARGVRKVLNQIKVTGDNQ